MKLGPEGDERHGVWIESLLGDTDLGPFADVIEASLYMDKHGLDDTFKKIVDYGDEEAKN